MADAEKEPEIIAVSKIIDPKADNGDGAVKLEETTADINCIHENCPENLTAVKAINALHVESTDIKMEGGQENGDVAKDEPVVAAEENEQNGDVAKDEPVSAAEKNELNGDVAKDESVAAAEGNAEEVTCSEAEGNSEVVVEEKKEEAPPKVILHQFLPGKHIPNVSPFCLKLETFLRINKIPYENQYGYKMGKKGKLPWIEYKGERMSDSNLIINFLNNKFQVDLDKDFTSEQLALGRATRMMLEENTYWSLVYNRYFDNFNEYKNLIAPPSGSGIVFTVTQKMFQRKMRANLYGQGLGRHTKEELYSIAEQDLKAISVILGGKPYLLGDAVSSFDCALFGLCANLLYSGVESPMSTYIKENATNLSSFCERMKEAYWMDWADIVLKHKAESASKLSEPLTENLTVKEDALASIDGNTISNKRTVEDVKLAVSESASETPTEESLSPKKKIKLDPVTTSNVEAMAEIESDKKE